MQLEENEKAQRSSFLWKWLEESETARENLESRLKESESIREGLGEQVAELERALAEREKNKTQEEIRRGPHARRGSGSSRKLI